ncbi:glycosyltransferase family 4 protein [Algoriphagus sp.]|uniref:glycosyltransferase family 4 protein n=1 Tax=Algoriphagus sp. TaxID=1872435 RepID=UPI002603F48C|nr:glycosyltransferase family 4 protein [Algoriphagus sp.]
MKIIYIHQYFRTPEEGGAVRSYHLAMGLIRAGMEVEMITAGNQPYYDQRWINGLKVHYLPIAYEQSFGFLKRVKAFLQFSQKSKTLLKKLQRPDLLYISSTPLTTGLIGLWAKKRLALPYVFEVRDLWPEAPVQVGVIRNALVKKYLYRLESKIYQEALKIVALSPGIASYIRNLNPTLPLSIIPNFADLERFFPQEKSPASLLKYGLTNELTIAYAGAIGQVNAVEELIFLAQLAQENEKPWQFLIMGTGSQKEEIAQLVQKLKLGNVFFIPFGSRGTVHEVLSLADFAWVSFAHLPVLKTNSPNKFFDAISAGKAIIVNHKGWVYQLVKKFDLGISCLPGNMQDCFAQLERLEENPDQLQIMQKNARRLAEQNFSKEQAQRRLAQLLDSGQYPPIAGDEAYILTA